jgi:hypothetical protein
MVLCIAAITAVGTQRQGFYIGVSTARGCSLNKRYCRSGVANGGVGSRRIF